MKIKAILIVGCVLLYLLVAVLWMGCNRFVGKYAGERIRAFEQEYNLSVAHKGISFKGLDRIEITHPAVILSDGDTLASARSLTVHLDASELLLFHAKVTGTEIDQLDLGFIRKKLANTGFLFQAAGIPQEEGEEEDAKEGDNSGYALKAQRFLDLLYKALPGRASLQNLHISYEESGMPAYIHIANLDIRDSRFEMELSNSGNDTANEWICKGLCLKAEQRIDFRLYTKNNSRITLPFITDRFGADVRLDTLAFEMQSTMREPGLLNLKGKAGVKGLAVYDERLATDTVILPRVFANFNLDIGKNYVEVQNNTDIQINKLKLNPYLKAEKEKDKDWHITASLEKESFPASELFESIPQGLFHTINGLEADGMLDYHFFLDVDLANVEKLKFTSTLDSYNFRIEKQGFIDLRMLNEPFTHTIYEKERPVRTFILGRENPDFRSYRRISKFLPYAIMHAEDAEFFTHKGFLPDAFRRSLIHDIEEKRFARGGSTLSMQMVKNVFLTRNKTIARKLEEITIVWLIETCRLSTKERMFEVYMNVIEWGPDVYGVTEAARYYFAKDPSALTLTECIFLAYILPDPKHIKDHFNGLTIKPDFRPFLQDATKRIYQRNWINARERSTASPTLHITGPATEYLLE